MNNLITVVIALIVVGIILWLINRYIPMASSIKQILNAVVIIGVILWCYAYLVSGAVMLVKHLSTYLFDRSTFSFIAEAASFYFFASCLSRSNAVTSDKLCPLACNKMR
jgi:hypothetical protein